MAQLNAPTIPIGLTTLFEDAGFLAAAKDKHKPCIKSKYYVDDHTIVGYITRRWNRDNPDQVKEYIRRVCEQMSQAIVQYNDTHFYEIILNKMVQLRNGIERIKATYDADADKCQIVGHIGDSILILDLRIPEHIKQLHGFSVMSKPIVSPPSQGVVIGGTGHQHQPSVSAGSMKVEDMGYKGEKEKEREKQSQPQTIPAKPRLPAPSSNNSSPASASPAPAAASKTPSPLIKPPSHASPALTPSRPLIAPSPAMRSASIQPTGEPRLSTSADSEVDEATQLLNNLPPLSIADNHSY